MRYLLSMRFSVLSQNHINKNTWEFYFIRCDLVQTKKVITLNNRNISTGYNMLH